MIRIDDGIIGPKYDYTTFRKGFAFEKAKAELSKQRQEAEIKRLIRETEERKNQLNKKIKVSRVSKKSKVSSGIEGDSLIGTKKSLVSVSECESHALD